MFHSKISHTVLKIYGKIIETKIDLRLKKDCKREYLQNEMLFTYFVLIQQEISKDHLKYMVITGNLHKGFCCYSTL